MGARGRDGYGLTMDTARSPSHSDLEPRTPSGAGQPLSTRLYARLLRAYPADFHRRYADQMVVLFTDQIRDTRGNRSRTGLAITWIRALADLASTALGEHLRRNRTVAQSLTTFAPTRSMRLLGLVGLAGGVLLLVAFLTFDPFETRAANMVRLVIFALGGAAVALAFYRRQALAAPALALVTAGAVVLSGVAYAIWLIVALWIPSPLSGPFGAMNMFANGALWLSATLYGAATLKIGTAWLGMPRWVAVATRLGAVALLGSALALIGDDRLGLVDAEPYGRIWSMIAMLGLLLNGAGWVLLGSVLFLAGRRTRSST
jgi:hypothetical protein